MSDQTPEGTPPGEGGPDPKQSDQPTEASNVEDKRRVDPDTGEVRKPRHADAGAAPADPDTADGELSDIDLELLDIVDRDLVGEYRERAARAEAELVNFRTRVERDRAANRESVIIEVIRSLLPAIDDLDRADAHGDLEEGSPLAIVAQKLRAGFDRYGMRRIGEVGEPFDVKLHEAIVRIPSPDVQVNTVADVIEPGYAIGERLIRAAKVAVHSPE